MITTINEWKNHKMNENSENSFNYMVTQHIGEYEEGADVEIYEKEEFLDLACSVLLGQMLADDIAANNLHVYMNDTEIPGGNKLVDLEHDVLYGILENNYEDYIYDLDEGDEIILSTTINSEEDL